MIVIIKTISKEHEVVETRATVATFPHSNDGYSMRRAAQGEREWTQLCLHTANIIRCGQSESLGRSEPQFPESRRPDIFWHGWPWHRVMQIATFTVGCEGVPGKMQWSLPRPRRHYSLSELIWNGQPLYLSPHCSHPIVLIMNHNFSSRINMPFLQNRILFDLIMLCNNTWFVNGRRLMRYRRKYSVCEFIQFHNNQHNHRLREKNIFTWNVHSWYSVINSSQGDVRWLKCHFLLKFQM